VLIEHPVAAFYTMLTVQALLSLAAGDPGTTQFTRRTVVPDLWHTDAFRAMNTLTTRLWGACSAQCDAAACALPDPAGSGCPWA
jgi:hypothetical protein